MELGRRLGRPTPESFVAPDGSHVQKMVESDGILADKMDGVVNSQIVPTLTKRQHADLAAEAVVDYLRGNNDTHCGNFLQMKDGSIMGIDKGLSLRGILDDDDLEHFQHASHVYYELKRQLDWNPDAADEILHSNYAAARAVAVKAESMPQAEYLGLIESMSKGYQFRYGEEHVVGVKAAMRRRDGIVKQVDDMYAYQARANNIKFKKIES